MTLRRFAPAVVAVIATIGVARAADAQGFVSPLIGYDFGGDSGCPEITGCEDRNLNVGVSAGQLGAVAGTELELSFARDFFGEMPGLSSSVLTLMGNLLLAPRFGPAQPYGVAGMGLIRTKVDAPSGAVSDSTNNHLGWNAGGGLIIFVARRVGVRGDIRYFHAFQDLELLGLTLGGTKLDFGRAAAALVFRF